MIAAQLAGRVAGSRQCGNVFRLPARCHGSESLTVALSDGERCAILRCHLGCNWSRMARAYHITLVDMFYERPQNRKQADLERELTAEAARYRARPIGDRDLFVASDLNRIRRKAGRTSIELPLARQTTDAPTWGHAHDPLWQLLLERAWDQAWIGFDAQRACCGPNNFLKHGGLGLRLLEIAERSAAAEIRSIARRERAESVQQRELGATA